MRTRIFRRLARDESGIALIAAIVVMSVMMTMTVAMLSYTAATGRDATLQHARQRATDLAEAGAAQALAQLASHYYDSSGATNNSTSVYSSSWFTGMTSSQQSPTSTSACTSSSTCMTWSVVSCAFSTTVAGCTLDSSYVGIRQGSVVVKGVGSVPNPTGGNAITKTVTEKVDVSQVPTLVQTPSYWKEIYAGGNPSGNCDLTLGQGVAITAPLYVGGDLCLTNTASISGSNVTLKVFGWVWLRQSSTIGSSSGTTIPRISSAQIAGGCSSTGVQPTMFSGCSVNLPAAAIWDTTPSTLHSATAPTPDSLPSIDWAKAQSEQANSTPAPTCTNGRSLNEATFNLTPTASYSCTSAVGSIAYTYNAGGTSTLSVSGSVYFAGNLSIDTQNSLVTYSGLAAFFVAGNVVTANNSFLCVKTSSGSCDFANATNSGSSNYWDPTQAVLLIQSQGSFTGTNLRFQGGIYSATSISIGGGNGTTQGPLVTPGTLTVGQQLNGSFPNFPFIIGGSLGTSPLYKLGTPYGATY